MSKKKDIEVKVEGAILSKDIAEIIEDGVTRAVDNEISATYESIPVKHGTKEYHMMIQLLLTGSSVESGRVVSMSCANAGPKNMNVDFTVLVNDE